MGNKKRFAEDPLKKKIFIVMNGGGGKPASDNRVAAGIFEIEMEISRGSDGKLILEAPYAVTELINPIDTFYKQKVSPEIASVGACVIGSECYLIPDERERDWDDWNWDFPEPDVPDRILPYKFNIIDETNLPVPSFPQGQKIVPVVVAVRDQSNT